MKAIKGQLRLNVLPQAWHDKPRTRGDCEDGPRPCPWVTCRYHTLLDISHHGKLFKSRRFDENSPEDIIDALARMRHTCALDVGELGAHTQAEVASILNVDQSSVAHTEVDAIARARGKLPPAKR